MSRVMCESSSMEDKQDAIDKWRTRLFRESNQNQSPQSWAKRLEKQIAILRVAIPFLTDSQIRGRAWYHCGFNSIMGDMPRSGLTPEIKKEFSKLKNYSPLKRMPRKSKVQRKIIREKSDDQMPIGSLYYLEPTRRNNPENNFSPNKKGENDFLKGSYTPISGVNILSDVSNGILKRGTKRKRKNSDVIKRIKVTDKVIEETPASSLGSGVKTFYCSQNLPESAVQCDPNIMQTILPSVTMNASNYTQTKISQSTVIPTIDDSKTISGLDDTQFTGSEHMFSQKDVLNQNAMNLRNYDGSTRSQVYVMSQLYNSQKQISQQNEFVNVNNQEYVMTQLYDSHSFVIQNQQSPLDVLDLSTAAASNSSNNSMTQSPQSIRVCPVNIPENTSESDEVDSSQSSNNKSQNINLGQSTPVKRIEMSEVRKKLSFRTLAEMYHNGAFVVKDNLSDRSGSNEISCEENGSPHTTAASVTHYSMINNPPTDFVMQGTPCIIFNQQKLCNKQLNTDFQDTSEFNTALSDSQRLFESFPTTPEDTNPLVLPPTLLLSNYCSEYDKAYTMKDLKPNQYRNYRHNESLRSLKEYLDSIIPPDKSLKDFYKIRNLP